MDNQRYDMQILWHPESSGEKIPVIRNWLQRLFYPSDFATLGEVLKYYRWNKTISAFRRKIQ